MRYTPVPCKTYGMYELAIVKDCPLRISWLGAQHQYHIESVTVIDVRIRNDAEFLVGRNQLGQSRILRLDRIRKAHFIQNLTTNLFQI